MKHPLSPPAFEQLLGDLAQPDGAARLRDILGHRIRIDQEGRYRHWDTLRHLQPPGDLSSEEWWFGIKLARSNVERELALQDRDGRPFRYLIPDSALQKLQVVDQRASGRIAMGDTIANPQMRDRYLVSSLIEEAITSSQLEGASTTRAVAADMLRSGREPRSIDERMIFNNYDAMNFVRRHVDDALTPSMLCELHAIVTSGTLDDPSAAGRFQTPDEHRVQVVDERDHVVLHTPPPAEQLFARAELMCRFANDSSDEAFLHPVVRSILLHFWLAYDHPFADGNGRVARALFYWSMSRHGYWLTEFLSISQILRAAPSKYARSFLHTETDDNDTTYFILYQLEVICRAIEVLDQHLARKAREVRETERLLRRDADLNHRQLALLGHALRHPDADYTYASHGRSHDVTRPTARKDLLDLEARGLVRKQRRGRVHHFLPADDLGDRIEPA